MDQKDLFTRVKENYNRLIIEAIKDQDIPSVSHREKILVIKFCEKRDIFLEFILCFSCTIDNARNEGGLIECYRLPCAIDVSEGSVGEVTVFLVSTDANQCFESIVGRISDGFQVFSGQLNNLPNFDDLCLDGDDRHDGEGDVPAGRRARGWQGDVHVAVGRAPPILYRPTPW